MLKYWMEVPWLMKVDQPLGFRYFNVDANTGFYLNGKHLDLHGVNRHQDRLNKGWGIGPAEHLEDFNLIKEMGANGIRLAHYQHAEYFYQLCDSNGMIIWAEFPYVNNATISTAFYDNAKQQLIELIRQNYNHPSIFFWGVGNELAGSPDPNPLMTQLNDLGHSEDPTRLTTYASNVTESAQSWHTDVTGFNRYDGWYSGSYNAFSTWADTTHTNHPSSKLGVSEYGAGASAFIHTTSPVVMDHSEEYQCLFHEAYWQAMKVRPFLWGKFIWNMFDFAVDGRNEGDTPGRNDKGMVTYDRKTKKDVFYYYKVNWTDTPVVYITSRRFTNRTGSTTDIKIYSNCDSVELKINGISKGIKNATGDRIFKWTGMTLTGGNNDIQAIGTKSGIQYSDLCSWTYTAPPGGTPISQGKTATASSYQTGNEVAKGNDGDTSTRWAAATSTYPQWWKVDLGANYNLTKVDIPWYNSSTRAYKYRIEVSSDDLTYSTKVDKTSNTTYGDTSDLFTANARYVRITITACTTGSAFASACEFRVYDDSGTTTPTPSPTPTIIPMITSASLAINNDYLDVVFNKGVYSLNNGTGALTPSDLALNFQPNGGGATNVQISSVKKNDSIVESSASGLTGGENTVRVFLNISGTPNGAETVEVKPFDGASIYDAVGNAIAISHTSGVKVLNPIKITIAPDQVLTETNLNGRIIYLNLSGTKFSDNFLSAVNFTLNNKPNNGLTINNLIYIDDYHCSIKLAYDGSYIGSNINNLSFTVNNEIVGHSALTSNGLSIIGDVIPWKQVNVYNTSMIEGNQHIAGSYRNEYSTTWDKDLLVLGKDINSRVADLWFYFPNIAAPNSALSGKLIDRAELILIIKNITGNRTKPRQIKIYTIIDPDHLGKPYYGSTDGFRTGLNFRYRDSRQGWNIPWKLNAANILEIFSSIEPLDCFEFVPKEYCDDNGYSTIRLNIKDTLQSWIGGASNQGLFVTLEESEPGEQIEIYGDTYADQLLQPSLQVIYANAGNNLTPPGTVDNLSTSLGDQQVTLNWYLPTGATGLRIVRKNGATPFSPDDGIIVYDGSLISQWTDTGLINGNAYYYAIYTYNINRNYSTKVWTKAIPGIWIVYRMCHSD